CRYLSAGSNVVLLFEPAAVTKRMSNAFMNNLTTGNVDAALALTKGGEANREFITQASEASQGSFALVERAMQDGKAYFLYDLSSEQGKMGRTILENGENGWQVASYVFGSDNLALISSEAPESAPAPAPETSTPVAKGCLKTSDLASLMDNHPGGTDFKTEGYTSFVGQTHFFTA